MGKEIEVTYTLDDVQFIGQFYVEPYHAAVIYGDYPEPESGGACLDALYVHVADSWPPGKGQRFLCDPDLFPGVVERMTEMAEEDYEDILEAERVAEEEYFDERRRDAADVLDEMGYDEYYDD